MPYRKQYPHKSEGARKRQASRVREDYHREAAKRGNPRPPGVTTSAQATQHHEKKAEKQQSLRADLRAEQRKSLLARKRARSAARVADREAKAQIKATYTGTERKEQLAKHKDKMAHKKKRGDYF